MSPCQGESREFESRHPLQETRSWLSWIERLTTNQKVGGSNPSERTNHFGKTLRTAEYAVIAQMVERILGKDKVTGSIPVNGSKYAGVAELADAHV